MSAIPGPRLVARSPKGTGGPLINMTVEDKISLQGHIILSDNIENVNDWHPWGSKPPLNILGVLFLSEVDNA